MSTPKAGRLLSGWGRTAPSLATLVRPKDVDEIAHALAGPGRCIARGLGRSYGDPAQCAGGTVLDLGAFDGIGPVDPTSGEMTVGAGASLHDLVCAVLPQGWFLPVTPGTRQVTVGGAIAADVHGKNHHRDGSIGPHVVRLTVVTPAHGALSVGPGNDPDLFWATVGGMGLTGVIVEATLRLLRVETDQVAVDTDRYGDLDAVMAAMVEGDAGYRYSVAWVDCTALGGHTGRAVLTRGDHASAADLGPRASPGPPVAPGSSRLTIPRPMPGGLLNPLSIGIFNELWFRRAPRHRVGELQSVGSFFHPLDGVGDWNLLYGPRGFLQYQFVVDDSQGEVVRRAVETLAIERIPSFLAVLKRFGPADPGLLSFPKPGWTLAVDIPVGPPMLAEVLDRLDTTVAEAGGRIYLAKDARMRPELLDGMYPRLAEFATVRARVDPDGVLASDQSRRLRIP